VVLRSEYNVVQYLQLNLRHVSRNLAAAFYLIHARHQEQPQRSALSLRPANSGSGPPARGHFYVQPCEVAPRSNRYEPWPRPLPLSVPIPSPRARPSPGSQPCGACSLALVHVDAREDGGASTRPTGACAQCRVGGCMYRYSTGRQYGSKYGREGEGPQTPQRVT